MRASRGLLRCLLLAIALVCAVSARAQTNVELRANQNYAVIMQQPVQTGDKIEVIDFFWYRCPYCYQLIPSFNEWLKRKPDDVVVRRVPAVLRESWLAQAHLYYTLELLGEADNFHEKVFDAHHMDRLNSNDPDAVAKWAVQNGFDMGKWQQAYYSPEVPNRVRRAFEITRAYGVPGTPAIVVDGRFLSTSGMAGSVKNLVPVMEALINAARERRSKASP